MKIIDLTHRISEDMPVYPGADPPKLEQTGTYAKDGYKETRLTMLSHTGTHMDSPAHLFADGTALDDLPVDQFAGMALVVDCSGLCEGRKITMDRINRNREKAEKAEFLLFYTGWDRYWGADAYFSGYPVIDDEVIGFLLGTKKKGVGLDVIGIDPIADANLTIHRKLLIAGEIVIIENLKNLRLLGDDLFLFCALPLKYKNSDGAPVRAIAILD